MTRRRWIADEFSGNHAALIGAHAEHLALVLRAESARNSTSRPGRASADRPRHHP